MPLSVAVLFEARSPGDARLALLSEPLTARGDRVTAWALDAGATTIDRVRLYPRVVRDLLRARQRGELDVVVLSGSARALALAAGLGRLGDVELVLDVGLDRDPGPPGLTRPLRDAVDVVVAAAATRVMARDPHSYQALLAAGVPAYRVGLLIDPPVGATYGARAKEPPLKGRYRVRVTVGEAGDWEAALAALVAAHAAEPKVYAELVVPAMVVPAAQARAASLGLPSTVTALLSADAPDVFDTVIAESHLALVWGGSAASAHAAGAALASGVPLVWATAQAAWGSDGAERIAPDPAQVGARIAALGRDKDARAALLARGRAWDESYGWNAQARLWLRAIDAACEEKVVAERRARQASIEGVKTGRR